MKALLFIVLCAIGGFYAYKHFVDTPAPAPAPTPAVAAPTSKPVDFYIKLRVEKLFGYWKRRQLTRSLPEASALDAPKELEEIRRRLFSQGKYSKDHVTKSVVSALRELGVSETECNEVANGILSLGQQESSSNASVIPANAQIPSSRKRSVGGGW